MHNKSQYKMRFIHYIGNLGNCFFIVSSQSFQVQTTQTSFETTTYEQYAPTAPVAFRRLGPSCIQAAHPCRLPVAVWDVPQGTETVGWPRSSWRLNQPNWKICNRQIGTSPQGKFEKVKIMHIEKNHHLEMSLKFVSIHCRGATYTQVHVAAFKQF